MSDTERSAAEYVIKTVQQVGYVAAENGELAKLLGFDAEAKHQSEINRRCQQLVRKAQEAFAVCDREDAAREALRTRRAAYRAAAAAEEVPF